MARHQREVKILMAARTLQKLNNANKRLVATGCVLSGVDKSYRMSKQTFESLEQAEKRAEAAEKVRFLRRER